MFKSIVIDQRAARLYARGCHGLPRLSPPAHFSRAMLPALRQRPQITSGPRSMHLYSVSTVVMHTHYTACGTRTTRLAVYILHSLRYTHYTACCIVCTTQLAIYALHSSGMRTTQLVQFAHYTACGMRTIQLVVCALHSLWYAHYTACGILTT